MKRQVVRGVTGLLLATLTAMAQQTIGSVAVSDATIAGTLQVTGSRAVLMNASSVTARDHTAEVTLTRGGVVRVCQTSGVTLSSSASNTTSPLMLALDRGAIELKTNAVANDIILTPDLRFAISHSGPIDLRIRVTRNGDTCVEQHSANAPMILISDTFGEKTYEVYSNQHILFEHGKLNEVVDHETSPCGCPEQPKTVSLADAALAPAAEAAAAQHPFPAAESTGLSPASEIPQAPPGELHTQVSATIGYEGSEPQSSEPPPMTIPRTNSPIPEESHGLGASIKRFFRHLFGGKSANAR